MAKHNELLDRDTASSVVDVYQMLHPIYLSRWRKGEGNILVS